MNQADIRAAVLQALRSIAPEVPSDRVRPGEDLREQLDLDSMDVVNLLAALEEKLGVHIGETDHARLATLDAAVAYLHAAVQRASGGPTRSPRAS